jgi:hypothetical protein
MINFKKIVNFSMPKRKVKKLIPEQEKINENEGNQNPNQLNKDQDYENQKENIIGEEDFWIDCK